jgi:hypothetical protein
MGYLAILTSLAVSGWILLATLHRFKRLHVRPAWWLAFASLALVGSAFGYWLAFRFEYHVSPEMRVCSFPIPVCFFHFEDGQWVDFPTTPWFGYSAMFANAISVCALAVLPVFFASFLVNRGTSMIGAGHDSCRTGH